jgi:hypothetical protein
MNDSITLSPDCFGQEYVTKINWFAAMLKDGVWKNIIQEIAIAYQLYYMWGEKCKIDNTINDMYLYLWNDELSFD